MADIAASSHLHENLDHPLGPIIYGSSVIHCLPVSLGQGGEGLARRGESSYFIAHWGE